MATSRKAVAALAALAATAAACDALLSLGDYAKVDCAFNCDAGEGGEGGEIVDGAPDATADVFDAGNPLDAGDAGDGEASVIDSAPEAQLGDAAGDAPSNVLRWAQWPMPNPDAAIAPEASTLLPHTMGYDAGADGGSTTVLDLVTGLTWWRTPLMAGTIVEATNQCASASLTGAGWHVPTRIELVSLIDFTQPSSNPTIDVNTFPGIRPQKFWTSSNVPGDGGAYYWLVDFYDGLTVTALGSAGAGSYVLCVREP
jgi:hypothetical protein